MKHLLLTCTMILVWGLGLMVVDGNAQVAYGLSIVRNNVPTRIVDSYSGTWLDYIAGLYYDPAVQGDIYRTYQVESSLAAGYHKGYADVVPAEVYLFTNNYVEGETYCLYSQHSVRAYFYFVAYSRWFDPFRYSSFIYNGGTSFPGYPFSYYYYYTSRYRLGPTQSCITVANAPTPTRTQPPTRAPSRTPCNPNLIESCQVRAWMTVEPSNTKPRGVSAEPTS